MVRKAHIPAAVLSEDELAEKFTLDHRVVLSHIPPREYLLVQREQTGAPDGQTGAPDGQTGTPEI